jgi:methionine synthase II (cobalamin-independent)
VVVEALQVQFALLEQVAAVLQ